MTVINFPGGKGSHGHNPSIERAVKLKQQLVQFVAEGPMRAAFEREMQREGLDELTEIEAIDFTDWFIFAWQDDSGATVLDEFLAKQPGLEDEDRRMLQGWYDALDDLFQVVERRDDGFVLMDEDGVNYLAVPTRVRADELEWEPGTTLGTRLLPVGDVYVLSGTQSVYANQNRAFGLDSDMPEAVVSLLYATLYEAFVAHFGSAETIVRAGDLGKCLEGYRRFALEEYRPPLLGKPLGAALREMGAPSLPEVGAVDAGELADEEVGLLADPQEGLALVPEYGALRRYVATGEGDAEAMRDLVLALLEDEGTPAFVFYRLADVPGSRLGSLLAEALDDSEFEIDRDLDDLLSEFKPDEDDLVDDAMDRELTYPDDIVDVRGMSADERPPGSIAYAAHAFLSEIEDGALKEATVEAHALGASLLAHYATEVAAEDIVELDAAMLLDFLAVWYPRSWSERSATGAKQLLTTMSKLTAWLDRTHHTGIGKQFKSSVLPALKSDLPRTVKAANLLTDAVAFALVPSLDRLDTLGELGSTDEIFQAVFGAPETDEGREGVFSVVSIDGSDALVRGRTDDAPTPGDAGAEEPICTIELPAKVAPLLHPGDIVEGLLLPSGDKWRVHDLVAIYAPAAGL